MSEKAEQLKAVGSLSALIAGFAMVVQTESGLQDQCGWVCLCLNPPKHGVEG